MYTTLGMMPLAVKLLDAASDVGGRRTDIASEPSCFVNLPSLTSRVENCIPEVYYSSEIDF